MSGFTQVTTLFTLMAIRNAKGKAYNCELVRQVAIARGRPTSRGHMMSTLRTLTRWKYIEPSGIPYDPEDGGRRGRNPQYVKLTPKGEAALDTVLKTIDQLRGKPCLIVPPVSRPLLTLPSRCAPHNASSSTRPIGTIGRTS